MGCRTSHHILIYSVSYHSWSPRHDWFFLIWSAKAKICSILPNLQYVYSILSLALLSCSLNPANLMFHTYIAFNNPLPPCKRPATSPSICCTYITFFIPIYHQFSYKSVTQTLAIGSTWPRKRTLVSIFRILWNVNTTPRIIVLRNLYIPTYLLN